MSLEDIEHLRNDIESAMEFWGLIYYKYDMIISTTSQTNHVKAIHLGDMTLEYDERDGRLKLYIDESETLARKYVDVLEIKEIWNLQVKKFFNLKKLIDKI